MKRSFPSLMSVLAASVALGVSLSGCGKKPEGGLASPPEQAPRGDALSLQAELDRINEIPHEHDPKRRLVVLSEPNTNRHDWTMRIVERGYADSGHSDRRWDEAAHRALQAYVDYSRLSTTPEHFAELSNAVMRATAAGCDDPLINYMDLRYGLGENPASKEAIAIKYIGTFRKMYGSHYHPLLTFYVGYRAIESAREADSKGNRSGFLGLVTGALEDLVHDTNAPPGEVFDAVSMWVDYTHAKGWLDHTMTDIQPNLAKHWGKEEACLRLLGHIEIERAWDSRGGGFVNTVNEKGWEGFGKHLEEADRLLNQAWRLNPSNAYTAYLMMKVELGQGVGRERMELWLNRAMSLAPGYYDAADMASYYLEPRWYGSDRDALAFARSCVTSTNWVGKVPLVLPHTHRSLARYYKLADSPEYWHRPGVWEDVRDGYEKFFKLNPEEDGWRHDYARDAYLCGRYDVFLAQTKLFSGWTNYEFFGGKEKFAQMLAKASAASTDRTQNR